MIPILYAAEETVFDTNGLGMLADAVDCTVIESSGKFELDMKYPVEGLRFRDIKKRTIITAKPDPVRDPQPFRVYRITKAMGGVVTVYARHLAYDTIGITCSPFSAENAASALQELKQNAVTDCPFTFWTDVGIAAPMSVKTPQQIWTLMGSGEGCILDLYRGEYEFDRYMIRLWNRRGADRGVSIRYGKNLTSLEQDENIANCYTAVHPYWANSDGLCVELPEKVVKAAGNFGYTRVMPLDLSQEWDEAPTEIQLRAKALAYIAANNIGVPAVSWKVQFVQLEQTEEYKGKALLERVQYGDTVSVHYEDLDVDATARVNEVRFKPMLERYDSVTLGDVKETLADTIISHQSQISRKPSMSQMQIAIQTLTQAILGAKGGVVRHLDTDGDDMPDTLYIADNPDPTKAVKVWRFNYEGWAASKNGYNGPFLLGASFDSGILAEFITAGTLYGMLIKAGTIESDDGSIRIDLNTNGVGPIFNTGISTNGLRVRADEAGANNLFVVDAYKNPNNDTYYGVISLNSTSGVRLLDILEAFSAADGTTPVGCNILMNSQDQGKKVSVGTSASAATLKLEGGGTASCVTQANSNAAGFFLLQSGSIVGGLSVNNGVAALVVSKINGKTVYWDDNGDGTYTLKGK